MCSMVSSQQSRNSERTQQGGERCEEDVLGSARKGRARWSQLDRSLNPSSTTYLCEQVKLSILLTPWYHQFPRGTVVQNPFANAGVTRDAGSIPGSGRSPGEGNGNALQNSFLGNPKDRRSLVDYSPWGCKEWDMPEHTQTHTYTHTVYCVAKKGATS